MNYRTISRIISAVIFGFVLAVALHHDELKRGQIGREEFMAQQSARFDRHYAQPDPIAIECFVGVCLALGLFGAYELAAFGIAKILKIAGGDEGQGPPVS